MVKRFLPERAPDDLEARFKTSRDNQAASRRSTHILNFTTGQMFAFTVLIALVILLAVVASIAILKPKPASKHQAAPLPTSILAQISGFIPYYLKPSDETDFTLQTGSITYQAQDNVLEFGMRDPTGHTLAFTEEPIPPGFDTTSLNADAIYQNEFGHAYISDLVDRTTGALFTDDGTWILINAPSPIGATAMRSIVDNLAPDKP